MHGSDTILGAHGFGVGLLTALVRAKLAVAMPEHMKAGGRTDVRERALTMIATQWNPQPLRDAQMAHQRRGRELSKTHLVMIVCAVITVVGALAAALLSRSGTCTFSGANSGDVLQSCVQRTP